MAESYVPVMIYDHKDKDTLEKYGVRAFPTFVVTDAEGEELTRQVGAPFSTPEEAREWFPKLATALNNVDDLEAKYEEDGEDVDLALELAETYTVLGKSDKAVALYKKVAPKISEEDDRYVDVQLAYADALMGGITRDNQNDVGKEIGAIYDKVLPGLIKEGDDRAVDPAILNARIKMIVDKDGKAARKQMTDMVEPYAEHDRILEIRYMAASIAQQNGDAETAKAEFKAITEEGDADDAWVKRAKQAIEAMDK